MNFQILNFKNWPLGISLGIRNWKLEIMHTPVLLKEVIALLDPKPGEFFVDGTFGSGGHTRALMERVGSSGKILAVDWDKNSIENLYQFARNFQFPISNFQTEAGNYADLPEILASKNLGKADGLLLDLGFSSEQIGPDPSRGPDGGRDGGRGFSFQQNEPLLMTYDPSAKPLKEMLKELTEEELAKIIKEFGEERFAGRIAKAIYNQQRRKSIETTLELAEIIRKAVPENYERGRLHPATRTFQALRIYANHELENLEKLLKELDQILKPGARVAIISFHSLEDRLVKNYFRDYAKAGKLEILTKKPIVPSREEIMDNSRARSAKLRAGYWLNPKP